MLYKVTNIKQRWQSLDHPNSFIFPNHQRGQFGGTDLTGFNWHQILSGEVQVNSLLYKMEKEAELFYESFVYALDGEEENPESGGHSKV